MPKVTIRRQGRTTKRVYKPCDVSRIAIYCLNDNPSVTSDQLLACIAKRMGYTHIATAKVTDKLEPSKVSPLVQKLESLRDVIDGILRAWGVDV